MAGTTNTYRPTALSFNSYGWKGSPQYNRADVPTRWAQGASEAQRAVLEQQLAYEWLDSSNGALLNNGTLYSNPPFTTDASGRLLPQLLNSSGQPARILRGFIRRAEYDNSDQTSKGRLYFMYNPESITRDYVSYLDQGALDPFNTVYQSGNLVPPPSYMDFSFSLFFDRQQEATNSDFPGVFVDYQFFDLVVRNVIPSADPNSMNNELPDNGVMMVNPRDITVVFSPQMTVQGRPSNARVSFTKFTHRMVPTRMTIDLTMRVTYFGPMKDMVQYTKEEDTVSAAIPWRADMGTTFEIKDEDIVKWNSDLALLGQSVQAAVLAAASGGDASAAAAAVLGAQTDITANGSSGIAAQIVDYGVAKGASSGITYDYDNRTKLWVHGDCSAFVWACYASNTPSYAEQMGWASWKPGASSQSGFPDSATMWNDCINGKGTKIFDVKGGDSQATRTAGIKPYISALQKGDLLFRINLKSYSDQNHVAMFNRWDGTAGASDIWVTHLGTPGHHVDTAKYSMDLFMSRYTAAYRPILVGAGQGVNNGGTATPNGPR